MHDHGEHYLRRIYTEAERHDCLGPDGPVPERLAARFAAKEAALKVLRPAQEAIPWRDIEVVRHPTGWVELKLGGRAAASAAGQGLDEFTLSISHEAGFATAVVAAGRA
jgi:holo-[acyl-carrier protein] synthase